jgi:anaerobic C4-dicarboxylate transporter DcuA/anaerobic C4-dicarboxylate transporter DcuB
VAPLVSFFFTVGAGTGNIFFALLPVIYEVSYANDIRPEKPLAASATASQMAIVCSPVSAAMAAMLTLVGTNSAFLGSEPPLSLANILMIVLPASLIGVLALSTVQNFIGKPLSKDPEYLERIAQGKHEPPQPLGELSADEAAEVRKGRIPALLFLGGVLLIIFFALFPDLRPMIPGSDGVSAPLSMNTVIQLIMMMVAVLIILITKIKPAEISKQGTWSAGITSMIALFGVAWLADTFIASNSAQITTTLGALAQKAPWAIAIAMFLVAALTTSQSSTTRSLIPIGLSLGIAPWLLVAMWPSVIGIYAFTANGSQIATVEMDQTGSTKISKFLLWHSFTIPMLVGWVTSVLAGIAIGYFFFGMGR